MRKALIAATFAGAIAIPGTAVAGPSLYDIRILLGADEPFAAAFYGVAPGLSTEIPAFLPAPITRAPFSPTPVAPQPMPIAQTVTVAIEADAPTAVPVEVRLDPVTQRDPTVRQIMGLALDQAYLAANFGFLTAGDASNSGTGVNNKWVFESGILVQAAYGYRLQDTTTEIEIAGRAVGAKTVTESGGAAVKATGNVTVLSFLANVTYEFPNQYQVTPYALGGLGFARYSAARVAAAGSSTVKSDDWVIGYQLGAGLLYPLNDKWTLDVSYRYFATTQPELKNAAGLAFKTDVSHHNFLMGARFKL